MPNWKLRFLLYMKNKYEFLIIKNKEDNKKYKNEMKKLEKLLLQ